MQIELPIAHKFLGLTIQKEQLLDPNINVAAGSYFLAYLKVRYAKTYPNTCPDGITVNPIGWIAAYNEGEPNLWRKRPDLGYVEKFVKYLAALDALSGNQA